MGGNSPTKILILAANPDSYEKLRLDQEVRSIEESLKRSLHREKFEIKSRWAVRERDFYRHVLELQPQILHFCGHGEGEDGIVLEDETGESHLISTHALASYFRLFAKTGLQGVVLNACYSAVQAEAISQVVDYVIGMNQEITDEAALNFAVAFYDGLGVGIDVQDAFDLGCTGLIDLGEAEIPILRQKQPESTVKLEINQKAAAEVIPPCPYQGLLDFKEEDQYFFFGRETFSQKLLTAVASHALVGVIGASGSGKSSVVFAGLIPQLRRQQGWEIAHFRPGEKPFHNLASTLVPLLETGMGKVDQLLQIKKLADALEAQDLGLGDVINSIVKENKNNKNTRFLLIVDQFEELYTLCQNPNQRQAFLEQLLSATNQDNFQVVLTLRADFLGYALTYRPFADALNSGNVMLAPMDEEELHSVITEPAKLLGVTLEPGLTERILADVGNEPGNLPLVEFALYRLWKEQKNKQLTHRGYEKIGGVKQALAHHADKVYEELSPQEQTMAQHIFLQLVRLGEDTQDTRRVVSQKDLFSKNHCDKEIITVVQKLVKARLIVTRSPLNPVTEGGSRRREDQAVIDVSHEALIRHWQQLRTWLDASRESLLFQRKIETAAREWKRQGKNPDYLWQGKRLREAREFVKKQGERFPLSEEAGFFVERSGKKLRRDWVRLIVFLLILPLIGTYFSYREFRLNNYAKLVRACAGEEFCQGRIHALEELVKGKRTLKSINLANANLESATLTDANLESANLYSANLYSANLYSANLYSANLYSANLYSATLIDANLNGAYLYNATLIDAKLENANLYSAHLESANLENANLYSANFKDANLKGAYLISANLYSANLYSAYFESATLIDANLYSATLIDAKNLTSQQIKSACNWEKAFYKGNFDEEQRRWIIDEKANEEYIKKLEADKASDPEKPVDCSRWE